MSRKAKSNVAESVNAKATDPAESVNIRIIPTDPAAQRILDALATMAESVPPERVADVQTGLFDRIIALDAVLGRAETLTVLESGILLWHAWTVQLPYVKSGDIRKTFKLFVEGFGRRFEVSRNRKARTDFMVRAAHVYTAVPTDCQDIIRGTDSAPFDTDTLVALSEWMDHDSKSESWTLRTGHDVPLADLVRRVAAESLSAAETRAAMADFNRATEMARIATLDGPEKSAAESIVAQNRKRDRTKAVDRTLDALSKSLDSVNTSSGHPVRSGELLVELTRRGILDGSAALFDPMTMDSAQAMDFATLVWENNPAASFVIREVLNRRAAASAAESKGTAVPSVKPELNDAPGHNRVATHANGNGAH